MTVEKQGELSQIPGLNYGFEALANISKPATWEIQKLSPATLQSIKLKVLGTDVFDPTINIDQYDFHDELDSQLLPLIKYCNEKTDFKASMLWTAPQEI